MPDIVVRQATTQDLGTLNRFQQGILEAERAFSRGVTEMRLEVYRDNLAAIKAYEKAGFSELLIEMRLRSNATSGS